nr:PAS domain S-box protein [Acidisphaera sp. L21]
MRFYVGVPVTASDGGHVGTICVLDVKPRAEFVTTAIVTLRAFAVLAADLLRPCATAGLLSGPNGDDEVQLLNSALQHASDGIMITGLNPSDPSGRQIVYVNDSFCRLTGYAPQDLVGESPNILKGAATDMDVLMRFRKDQQAGIDTSATLMNYRKDGSELYLETRLAPIKNAQGIVTHYVGVHREVGDRLADQHGRKELYDAFHLLFDNNPLPMWVFDPVTLRFLIVNNAAVAFYGWSRAEFLCMTLRDIRPVEELEALERAMRPASNVAPGQRVWTHKRADGSILRVGGATQVFTMAGVSSQLGVVWDLTEVQGARDEIGRQHEQLKQVVVQLHARTEELSNAHRLAKLGTWWISADLSQMTWSDEIYTLLGRERGEFAPSYENATAVMHDDDRELFRSMTQPSSVYSGTRRVEARVVRRDGRIRHVTIESFRAQPDFGQQHEAGFVGYIQDVTERRETEQALMRAEKLAILGHLTGGIAHDFNNLLTVVTLNLEEVIETLPDTHALQDVLVPALHAAQRSAQLTNQMLAYARQAPLSPKAVSLANFLTTFRPAAARALGGQFDLTIVAGDEPCMALVDPAQLQVAVLNIVLNARDAMPEGGQITVEAAAVQFPAAEFAVEDVAPGTYAMIAVIDSGPGIAATTLPHIFEPFFTTKAKGVGSGLGLSMVDGFVRQSGGHIIIQSVVGGGTTMRLFLPTTTAQNSELDLKQISTVRRRALLVEDQPAVLATVSRMFAQLGYDVCGVDTAAHALAELDQTLDFAVLFTDIVLPGDINGVELSKIVSRRAPNIQILLTSGFSNHDLSKSGVDGSEVLIKPYRRQDLLDRLNRIGTTK